MENANSQKSPEGMIERGGFSEKRKRQIMRSVNAIPKWIIKCSELGKVAENDTSIQQYTRHIYCLHIHYVIVQFRLYKISIYTQDSVCVNCLWSQVKFEAV